MLKVWKSGDLADKIQLSVTYLLRILIITAIIGEVINQRWALLFATTLIFFLTFIPSFIEERYKIQLPIEFEFVIILFIYASLFLGEIKGIIQNCGGGT